MKRYFKEGAWVFCNLTNEYGWIDFYENGGYYKVAVHQSDYTLRKFSILNLCEMKLDIDSAELNRMYIEMALISKDKDWFNELIRKGGTNETEEVV